MYVSDVCRRSYWPVTRFSANSTRVDVYELGYSRAGGREQIEEFFTIWTGTPEADWLVVWKMAGEKMRFQPQKLAGRVLTGGSRQALIVITPVEQRAVGLSHAYPILRQP